MRGEGRQEAKPERHRLFAKAARQRNHGLADFH